MKKILAAALMVVVWTAVVRSAEPPHQAHQEAKDSGSEMERLKGKIAIGKIFSIKLPCNPTTGYAWEIKSINRKIAVPTGPAEFLESPAAPGTVGVGGYCAIGVKGVKPGKTKAILVYRRSWEKGEPAKMATADITVLPKKNPLR